MNNLFDNIKTINSLYSKIYIYYLLFIIFTIIILPLLGLKSDTNDHFILDRSILNGKKTFRYKCPLDEYHIILSFVEFLLFIPLVGRLKKLWTYECIFKLVKYLGLIIILWVTTGPFLNFVSSLVLRNYKKSKTILIACGNVICYIPLYYCYMFNLIDSIVKKQGNNTKSYFIYPSNKFCFEHKIYNCSCNFDFTMDETESKIDAYLIDYNYCSKLFEISNRKTGFVSNLKKISHKNLI